MRRSVQLLRPLRSALSTAPRPLLARPSFSALASASLPSVSRTVLPRAAFARRWASTEAAAPDTVPVAVEAPDINAIKEEGFIEDPALVPAAQATLAITPEATAQLAKLKNGEPADTPMALRVGVDSGGCHGYQYIMELTEEKGTDDYVFRPQGVDTIPVYCDLTSLGLLKGATLHYATELIGSSFRLQDNPQAKEGGNCGCGVSWEAKVDI